MKCITLCISELVVNKKPYMNIASVNFLILNYHTKILNTRQAAKIFLINT